MDKPKVAEDALAAISKRLVASLTLLLMACGPSFDVAPEPLVVADGFGVDPETDSQVADVADPEVSDSKFPDILDSGLPTEAASFEVAVDASALDVQPDSMMPDEYPEVAPEAASEVAPDASCTLHDHFDPNTGKGFTSCLPSGVPRDERTYTRALLDEEVVVAKSSATIVSWSSELPCACDGSTCVAYATADTHGTHGMQTFCWQGAMSGGYVGVAGSACACPTPLVSGEWW